MRKKRSHDITWAYGAGALGGVVSLSLLVLIAQDTLWPIFTRKFYLTNERDGFDILIQLITIVGGGATLGLVLWRTFLFDKQLKQQKIDQLEMQFRHGIELLTADKQSSLAGALIIEQIVNKHPVLFAQRAADIFVTQLAQSSQIVVIDAQSEAALAQDRDQRWNLTKIFASIRFKYHDFLDPDKILDSIRNIPAVSTPHGTHFLKFCDFGNMEIIIQCGFLAFDTCKLGTSVLSGKIGDSLFITDCDLTYSHFRLEGGRTNIQRSDLRSLRFSNWDPNSNTPKPNWSRIHASVSNSTAIHRDSIFAPTIELRDCWYDRLAPYINNPGFQLSEIGEDGEYVSANRDAYFDAADGILDGQNKLGMPIYTQRRE